MENLLESIRTAVTADASDEARAAGAQACRAILTALEAKPGEPMTVATPAPSGAADTAAPAAPPAVANAIQTADPTQIANLVSALRGIPVDQLLDLAIARMRAALPSGVEAPRVEPLKFHIVQLPGRRP